MQGPSDKDGPAFFDTLERHQRFVTTTSRYAR